jgi:hypothetical protein
MMRHWVTFAANRVPSSISKITPIRANIHGLIGRFVIQNFVGSSGTGEMACRWKLAPDGCANFSSSLSSMSRPTWSLISGKRYMVAPA